MDGKMLARFGALVFVAFAITATAIELNRKEAEPAGWSAGPIGKAPADPLRAELIRCQQLGEAGPRDAACLRGWAENRQRFLGPDARPVQRAPNAGSAQMAQPEAAARSATPDDSVVKETAPQLDEDR